MIKTGRMAREAGTALAVLAIYVLTLLLPLHQSAALSRELATLGFQNTSLWTVCMGGEVPSPDDPAPAKCALASTGKHHFAMVLPPAPPVLPARVAAPARLALAPLHGSTRVPYHVGQARAPPQA